MSRILTHEMKSRSGDQTSFKLISSCWWSPWKKDAEQARLLITSRIACSGGEPCAEYYSVNSPSHHAITYFLTQINEKPSFQFQRQVANNDGITFFPDPAVWFPNYNCFTSLHYGASSVVNWKLRNCPK